MQRPFVILCPAFCLGIIFAIRTTVSLWVFFCFAIGCLFCGLITLNKRFWFTTFILACFFMLGAAQLRNFQFLPHCHIARYLGLLTSGVSLKGVVISDPLVTEKKTTFTFSVRELIASEHKRKICGKVLVNVYGKRQFSYGQYLILTGKLFKPYRLPLSSGLNYRDYLQRKGMYAILSIGKKGGVQDLGINKGTPVIRFAIWLKSQMEQIIERDLKPLPASILNAMLLGERRSVPKSVNESMVKTGTVHILVVSGFNVGIVAFIFLNFFKALRISRSLRIWLTILVLVIYCLLTGASTPVVRATIMGLIFLLGWLIEREPDIYNSLSLAAIIILAFNPWQVLDVGFQLSFVSVLSIVWLHPKIRAWFPSRLLKVRLVNLIIQAFAVSLSAWLGTAGLVAYYFHIVSVVTVLANVVIVPVTSFITACGFAMVVFGKVLPGWGYLFARSCELAILGLLKVNFILAEAKGAHFRIRHFPAGFAVGYYLIVLILFGCLNLVVKFLKERGLKRFG